MFSILEEGTGASLSAPPVPFVLVPFVLIVPPILPAAAFPPGKASEVEKSRRLRLHLSSRELGFRDG
jgi:hypothetical protein